MRVQLINGPADGKVYDVRDGTERLVVPVARIIEDAWNNQSYPYTAISVAVYVRTSVPYLFVFDERSHGRAAE